MIRPPAIPTARTRSISSLIRFPVSTQSPSSYFDFDPSSTTNDKMTFTIPHNSGIVLSMEWDQPYYTMSGVTTDLDIYLLNSVRQRRGRAVPVTTSPTRPRTRSLDFRTTGASASFSIVINKSHRPESR